MTKEDYKPPKGASANYKRRWRTFLPSVINRPNFSPTYIEQLRLLCDLLEDYDRVSQVLREEPLFYTSDGRYGEVIKEHPAFRIKAKLLSEIRAYSKLLGIVLDKDQGQNDEEEEW